MASAALAHCRAVVAVDTAPLLGRALETPLEGPECPDLLRFPACAEGSQPQPTPVDEMNRDGSLYLMECLGSYSVGVRLAWP